MTAKKDNHPAKVENYLFFNGRCEEAIEFYRNALGAEVQMLVRFKESPDQSMIAPGMENKVMHATLKIGETTIMASDGRGQGQLNFDGFSLSIPARNPEEAQKLFAALSDGGKVGMPMGKTFFSPCFGMTADKFGVGWMVIVPQHT
jgi:PhnB protein